MKELSLHLLDIAENSISAGAKKITIVVAEDSNNDLLQMKVIDDGKGMSEEMLAVVVDPFITTRTTRRVGLGIPLLKAAAEACDGFLELTSQVGKGTSLSVQFKRSHIDRMPLGDLLATMLHLIVANPAVHWVLEYQFNNMSYIFDDYPIKQELGDVELSEPGILQCLREMISTGVLEVNPNFSPYQITLPYKMGQENKNVYDKKP